MNTDTRLTIPANGSFYEQVKALFDSREPAALLYEFNGVTRANGTISEFFEKEGSWWLKMDDGQEIRLDWLQAVNGTFSSDYSEC